MPGDSTWLLVLSPVAALTGAIIGVAANPTPLKSSKNISNLLPEQRTTPASFDRRNPVPSEDRYPLETPHGVVLVEELEAHGRLYGAHQAVDPVTPGPAPHAGAGAYGMNVAAQAPVEPLPVATEAERVRGPKEEESKGGPKIVDVAATLASYESRY